MFQRSTTLGSGALLSLLYVGLFGCTVEVTPSEGNAGGAQTGGNATKTSQLGGSTSFGGATTTGGVTAPASTTTIASAGSAGLVNVAGSAGLAGAAGANVGGSSAGAGAAGVAGMGDGVAGAGPVGCGAITSVGVCQNDVLTFCEDSQLKSLDCATVGASCALDSATGPFCKPTSRALSCGALTKLGTCDGAVMRYCDETGIVGVPRDVDCSAYGKLCNPTAASDGGADCVPQGVCPTDVTNAGQCSGNHLRFCQDKQLYEFDCGLDQCKTVSGFSDCFMAEVATGCGSETPAGRCSGTARVSCAGNTIVTEDCAAVGLECRTGAAGMACLPPTKCSVTCPSGFACSNGHCAPSGTPTRDWTIAVYMVGNNNLSDAAWGDLNEMEAVGSSSALTIATEVEFSSLYSSDVPEQYRGPTYRMLVSADSDPENVTSLASATTLPSTNMSDGASLTSFIQWAASSYPAKHFALVLWDHGMGYYGGFVDESAGGSDYLTLKELTGAIVNSGIHPDLVALDACLMGMHEVALSLRGVTDWMTASEEIEPGSGYPYDQILLHLKTTPNLTPQLLGSAIVDEYSASTSSSSRTRTATQSLMDLSKASAFNDQLSSFSETVSANVGQSRPDLMSALGSSDVIRFKMQDNADIGSAMTAVSAVGGNIGAAAVTLDSYLTSSGLVARNAASGNDAAAKGLGFFFPQPDFSATTLYQYRSETSYLPLQSWVAALTNIRNNTATPATPGTGAVDAFSVLLSWANTPDGKKSGADLDLYVYEPNGDFAVAVNGSVSQNGTLSGDSYDTGVNSESYTLKSDHETGTYIVLVHYYDGPKGESAYPRLQLFRNDIPGGSRSYVRGKITNKKLVESPMSNTKPLTTMIDETNFAAVQNLDYTNIWYAITIEVK